jgi:chorismate dehydratase
LLIGDHAIRFREQYGQNYSFLDLGAEWNQTTQLPFVFALWLIRPEIDVVSGKNMADRLRARRDENLRSLGEVISAQRNFSPGFCRYYFRECLDFRFSEAEKEGLLRFQSLCEIHRILKPNPGPLRLV